MIDSKTTIIKPNIQFHVLIFFSKSWYRIAVLSHHDPTTVRDRREVPVVESTIEAEKRPVYFPAARMHS